MQLTVDNFYDKNKLLKSIDRVPTNLENLELSGIL